MFGVYDYHMVTTFTCNGIQKCLIQMLFYWVKDYKKIYLTSLLDTKTQLF